MQRKWSVQSKLYTKQMSHSTVGESRIGLHKPYYRVSCTYHHVYLKCKGACFWASNCYFLLVDQRQIHWFAVSFLGWWRKESFHIHSADVYTFAGGFSKPKLWVNFDKSNFFNLCKYLTFRSHPQSSFWKTSTMHQWTPPYAIHWWKFNHETQTEPKRRTDENSAW